MASPPCRSKGVLFVAPLESSPVMNTSAYARSNPTSTTSCWHGTMVRCVSLFFHLSRQNTTPADSSSYKRESRLKRRTGRPHGLLLPRIKGQRLIKLKAIGCSRLSMSFTSD
uniref:Uncharacterized protein n=1 Tax=Aegilops tauschii subsp. strangulata TaxID=200361 RepID=A0A452YVN4_AEGTS